MQEFASPLSLPFEQESSSSSRHLFR